MCCVCWRPAGLVLVVPPSRVNNLFVPTYTLHFKCFFACRWIFVCARTQRLICMYKSVVWFSFPSPMYLGVHAHTQIHVHQHVVHEHADAYHISPARITCFRFISFFIFLSFPLFFVSYFSFVCYELLVVFVRFYLFVLFCYFLCRLFLVSFFVSCF